MMYVAAFLIPAVIYTVTLTLTGTWPFGDNALLVSDISNQFAAFYTYFKNILISNDDMIYTFAKSLGGDMPGFAGYYLNNPFLFLLLLFKDEYVPAGIVLIIGIQLGLMGVTMAILLKDIAGSDSSLYRMIPFFSTAYAFSGYVLAYITLPIYFCSLIMFPLVMLGIRRLMRGSRSIYVISLCLAIVFNYYIGYMICIFSVLYFLAETAYEGRLKEKKLYADFALSSLTAGALSAFSVIPTVLSLRGEKASSLSSLIPNFNYNLRVLFRNLFTGAFKGDCSNYSAPYIYVGEAVLLCVVYFFICSKISIKRKVMTLALFAVLFISSFVSSLDVIWHGFTPPVGFPCRYAFLICALFVVTGFEGYTFFAHTYSRKAAVKILTLTIAAGETVLLLVNAVISVNAYDNRSLSEYAAYSSFMSGCISGIKEEDDGFYRIEKDFERNSNDAMMFSYAGLSHNSSCDKDHAKRFLAKMGIRYFEPIWTFYNQGSTVFADCFLGVKYFISRFDTTIKPYDHEFEVDGVNERGGDMTAHVYKNPYALPLCFGVAGSELATDMDDDDLFRIQNGIAGTKIYTCVNAAGSNCVTSNSGNAITTEVKMPFDGNLYFYATASDYRDAELFVNDVSFEDYFSESRWDIVPIGQFRSGESVNVTLTGKDGSDLKTDDVHTYIYAEDIRALKQWYDKASKEAGSLVKVTSSRLNGSIHTSDSERIVFTIPYEKAWKIRLDGKRVDTKEAFGALLSVDVLPGDHTIEMVYIPEGMTAGVIITSVTLVICLGLTFRKHNIKIKS